MIRARALLLFALLGLSAGASAHHAPNSYLRLDFRADKEEGDGGSWMLEGGTGRDVFTGGTGRGGGGVMSYKILAADGHEIGAMVRGVMQPSFYLPPAGSPERDAAALMGMILYTFPDPANAR